MNAAAVLGAAPEEAMLAHQKNVAALSQVRPDARTDKQVDSLVLSTRQLDAFANLSAAEHGGLAKVWTHDQLGGGEYLCRVNGMEPAYFIVVSGAMEVESQRLSHNLGENDVTVTSTNSMRTTVVGVGMAFGQYPLLHDTAAVDYSAKAAPCGCGVLRVSKNHYAGLLRRHEEKVLGEAVRMLRASPFFSDWTVASLERLYFILERRRLQPGVDVVTQGDIADFCFIIASGKCDLVVNPPTGPERFITQPTPNPSLSPSPNQNPNPYQVQSASSRSCPLVRSSERLACFLRQACVTQRCANLIPEPDPYPNPKPNPD